ncbi:hypothetical protein ATKI12_7896 [Kitasatospora sp. Ki12]
MALLGLVPALPATARVRPAGGSLAATGSTQAEAAR